VTEKSQISLAAVGSESERQALQVASRYIARALSRAAESPWTCECDFSLDLPALGTKTDATIFVTSLLPELEKLEEPWPVAQTRLRAAYATLAAGGIPVFTCTIFRHVGPDTEAKAAEALRVRIRRLNLLAAELSREHGLFVIDLDRVLADAGARRFPTDYRLAGDATAEIAGHFIALTLVTNGVDAVVPYEVQDAARAFLVSNRPAIPGVEHVPGEITLKKDLLSLGHGRRKQKVATVAYTVEDNYAGWLVGQVLRGAIGPGEAMQRLVHAVRRRGVKESAAMLASGLSRQIQKKK
jgi:hypothetical protein